MSSWNGTLWWISINNFWFSNDHRMIVDNNHHNLVYNILEICYIQYLAFILLICILQSQSVWIFTKFGNKFDYLSSIISDEWKIKIPDLPTYSNDLKYLHCEQSREEASWCDVFIKWILIFAYVLNTKLHKLMIFCENFNEFHGIDNYWILNIVLIFS